MAGVVPWRRVVVLVFSVALLVPVIANLVDDGERRLSDVVPLEKLANFQTECSTRCPFQNKTEVTENSYYVGCGVECNIQQCSHGCRSWQLALDSSCQIVCNGTEEPLLPKELYCVMGCNDALSMYYQRLREELGTPPAPALVADSLTATSLSLEWEGPRLIGSRYLVQWRYEELSAAWQFCCNQSWGPRSTVRVDNLQPYTKYRFRVALLLEPPPAEPLVSEPSVVISTLPHGVPSSPPTIVRAAAVDPGRISVSWEAGPFPNGPILSYVLQIRQLPDGNTSRKDFPATGNTDFYMFQHLAPGQRYNVSVAMRNAVGEGPAASVVLMTPPAQEERDAQQAVLVLCASHTVTRQSADMLDEPGLIYNSSEVITGVALHVRLRLLFVADVTGAIWRVPLNGSGDARLLLQFPSELGPHQLSVDWLNDLLYVVADAGAGGWQVARIAIDSPTSGGTGRGLTVAVAGLPLPPLHIEVDPYSGFLFLAMSGGLYRLDLADISNGVKHEARPVQLLAETHIGAFVVDHTNFRLLVAHRKLNTVLAVSLDGSEVSDVRNNTQQPMFAGATSLACANGLFYWTDGDEVLAEEYHAGQNSYYHNAFPEPGGAGGRKRRFVAVLVDLPTAQPIPVPVNPPTSVQAVLGSNVAKISWHQPHLLGGQGKGAWQNWSFVVDVQEEAEPGANVTSSHMVLERREIRGSWCALRGLRPGTRYVVRAAAYSSAGVGPWSAEFRGTSLRLPGVGRPAPAVLWSAADGLLRSDVTGDDVRAIVHRDSLKDAQGPFHVADMAWFEDRLYLVANTTQVYCFNTTSRTLRRLRHVDSAGSIAVDWLGGRLYTSNPKQQLISRSHLDGSMKEPLPILTVAKELNIDAVHAYIYWSTGHAVEVARLNGKSRRTYFPPELFSGKHGWLVDAVMFKDTVMGLTLDLDSRAVYWVVRSYEGASLYKAPTAETLEPGEVQPTRISKLQHPSMQGPLSYLSDHLLWLQDDRNAVIADLNGQSAAVISGMALSGLHTVVAWDPDLHRIPTLPSKEKVCVIPVAVSQSSIRVEGTWQKFNVTWKPVKNVNFGQVFYEVKIRSSDNTELVQETTRTAVRCCTSPSTDKGPLIIPPHSELQVAIRAITFWGSSSQVSTLLRSPPARPGPPQRPRVFVTFEGNTDLPLNKQAISALFRWDPPTEPNGELSHYVVRYWRIEPEGDFPPVIIEAQQLEFQAQGLEPNFTYYFQVQAFTPAGGGASSDPVAAWSAAERPVPRLLVATADALLVADCDRGGFATALRPVAGGADAGAAAAPIDLAVLLRQRQLLWLSGALELRAAQIDGSNLTKLAALSGPALAVAADWVGRTVYWAEQDEQDSASVVLRMALDAPSVPKRVLRRRGVVRSLSVAPLTSTLFWVEQELSEEGLRSVVMAAATNGSSIRPFLGGRRGCSCKASSPPSVAPTVTVDHTGGGAPRLLWFDSTKGHVMAADMDGCQCQTVIDAKSHVTGASVVSITADQTHIYWSDSLEGRVYAASKDTNHSAVAQFDLQGVRRVTAIGPHLQPFPAPECLVPLRPDQPPTATSKTSSSITLSLPAPRRPSACDSVTLATTTYTVLYAPAEEHECPKDIRACHKLETSGRKAEITGLLPFTQYVFIVAVSNYYMDVMQLGPLTYIQTDVGAPTPPRKVNVRALDPNSIKVTWLSPERIHSASVIYELHWRAEGPGLGEHTSGQQLVGTALQSTLHKMAPDQSYIIWVSARADTSEAHSDSLPQYVRTMPRPNVINLVRADPYALTVSWIPAVNVSVVKCDLQYSIAGSNQWRSQLLTWNQSATSPSAITTPIEFLEPKTRYTFRLAMLFPEADELFIWPSEGGFTFETVGDRPSPPGTPIIQFPHRDVYQVTWKKSRDNGAPILVYCLEGWKRTPLSESGINEVVNNTIKTEPQWETLYNGTEPYWIVPSLVEGTHYVFRVRALNSFGWSDWSRESHGKDLGAAALLAKTQEVGIVLAVTMPIGVVVLCIVALLIVVCVSRRRQKHKKALQAGCVSTVNGHGVGVGEATVVLPRTVPDVELATLREMPRRANFIHRLNTLYSLGDHLGSPEDDLVAVPRISRHQITLTKFLGSGAFGEVFEGNARGVADAETRVAIKTLRKGATEQEKAEFLKEAQLMSHFRHAHILQLLGVCLDNDPNFIIMELMEAGDLLSFLRSRRPPGQGGCVPLTLPDLLAMCVDVARGCRYLEEMHFVHRDLAARNCLVSSSDPQTRVVKIGDFGLARDIYKNDYYRKEGEGMLPVRWMAPESLVDGVFTSQSDVWAFGVLLWEVITMGQQPYPARNNIEVLHYVRGGGLPGRPANCPDQMHQLMVKCWQFSPDARPTFKYCLQVLEDLKTNGGTIAGTPVPSIPTHHFINRTSINGGFSNRGFFEDENHNSSGDSWKTSSDGSRDQEPFLQQESPPSPAVTVPKYLELIYDTNEDALSPVAQPANVSQPLKADGYEIPRQPSIISGTPPQNERMRTLSSSSTVSDTSVASGQQLVKMLPALQTIRTGTE